MRRSSALLLLLSCTFAAGLQLHLAPLHLSSPVVVSRVSWVTLAKADDKTPPDLETAMAENSPSADYVDERDDDDDDDDDDADTSESEGAESKGPFASTIGRWDGEGEPEFLQEMDWHISSTYTEEEKEALQKQSDELEADATAAAAGGIGDGDEDDLPILDGESYEEPTYEFISYDEGKIDLDAPLPTAQTPMPSSWQEYQFLQEQMSLIADGEEGELLSPQQREKAARLKHELDEFYGVFSSIISYEWKLEHNPSIEEAGLLVKEMLDAKARRA